MYLWRLKRFCVKLFIIGFAMRRPFQRCVYPGGSACSCWDIALWVRRPTSSLLEAEKSVDKGLKEKKRKMVCRVQGTVKRKKLVQVLLAVAGTNSQSQGRTLRNGFSCLISLPTNFSKKKKRKIDLLTPSPFDTFFSSTTTCTHLIHAPHMANCPQNLDQFLSLYRTLYTTNHFSFLLF